MNNIKHNLPINLLKLLDLLLVVLTFGVTTVIVVRAENQISLVSFLSMRTKVSNFFIFLLVLLMFHYIFRLFGIYRSRRLSRRREEIADLFKSTTLSVICLSTLGALLSIRMLTIPFLLIFWLIATGSLSIFHFTLRAALACIRAHGRNLRHLLILGTNVRAVAFARILLADQERGYRLLGFVDDDWTGMADFRKTGFQVVSDYDGLTDYLRKNVVDEAVIYLPFGSFYHHWTNVANLFLHHGIKVRLNSDMFGLNNARWLLEEFDGSHYIATHTGAGEGWPLAAKRTLDVVISFALLILLIPLFILVAIGIRLSSPGPVLFLQERVGLNKRHFKIYKFRTMVPNAEQLIHRLENKNEVSGPVFKIKNDPRITHIGRLLRRTSIDELPQLFNVLKGDMSLVGPRPLPVRDYQGFSEDWQRRRFSVRPGITCLWQINGRSGVAFDEWMLLDLQYMDEWSLWLDFKILAKTLPAVLKGVGAV